jgi:hypothetical protein
MQCLLAALPFVVSSDILVFDGKYTDAVQQPTVIVVRHF